MFTVLGYYLGMRHESIYNCEDAVHVAVFRVMKLCNLLGVSETFGEKVPHTSTQLQDAVC